MPISLQTTPPTCPSISLESFDAEPKAAWLGSVVNFFTGKMFQNWERSALMVCSIAKVFFAAVSLFTGSFFFSIFLLVSAAIDAIAIAKLRRFGTDEEILKSYKGQNIAQRQRLWEFKKENTQYAELNQQLEGQLGTHRKLVEKHAENTAVQGRLTAELTETVGKNGQVLAILDSMVDRAEGHEKEQLEKLRKMTQLAQEVHQKNAAITTTQEQLNLSNEELLMRAGEIGKVLEQADQALLKNIAGLREDLKKLERSIQEGQGQVEALKRVTERLDGAIMDNVQKTNQNAEQAGMLLQGVLSFAGSPPQKSCRTSVPPPQGIV